MPDEPVEQVQPTSFLHLFLDLAESFVVAIIIFVIVYNFIAQPHRVRGDSMLPNYHNDEYILTEKLSYRFGTPQRGDVIVLHYPENPEVDFIKRIVGLPGETILLKGGSVYIDGEKLDEPYLQISIRTDGNQFIKEGTEYTIPLDQYIVMGDNRERSSDSRAWGTVPGNYIVGKGFFIYWPMNEFGVISDPKPVLETAFAHLYGYFESNRLYNAS